MKPSMKAPNQAPAQSQSSRTFAATPSMPIELTRLLAESFADLLDAGVCLARGLRDVIGLTAEAVAEFLDALQCLACARLQRLRLTRDLLLDLASMVLKRLAQHRYRF